MGWLQNHIRAYRLLLYCYPAAFRQEYGSEMEQLFADRVSSEPRLRLWLETIADIVVNAISEHWATLAGDVKHGVRVLSKSPSFTAFAVCIVALGIGSTVAVFSVINAVLLRSLPYGEPNRLVYLWSPNPDMKGVPEEIGPNVPDFYAWKGQSHSFSSISAFHTTGVNLVQDGFGSRVGAAMVTGDFFQTLQTNPAIGRTIDRGDDQPGHSQVVVISYSLWTSRFGAASSIIGKQVQVNRQPYTVIGVMPKDFGYPFEGDVPYEHTGFKQTDVWLPAGYTSKQKSDRTNFDSADAIGRLRPGLSARAAQSELKSIESRLEPLYPPMWRGWTARVDPLIQTIIGPVHELLWFLLAGVSLVLLIAISNVTNLALARAAVRAHELGIRTALGANRSRIVRQLLTESLILSSCGGAVGVGLAYGFICILKQLDPGGIPRFASTNIDGLVLFAAVLLSIVAGILSGIAPAFSASRVNINRLLGRTHGRVAGPSVNGRSSLIALQIALSLMLLTGSGLLLRSYLRLVAVNPGFSKTAITFAVSFDEKYRRPQDQFAFERTLLTKLQAIPNVRYAGSTSGAPLTHHESVTFADIRGYGKSQDMVENFSVTPEYRKALGISLLRGKDLSPTESQTVLINAAFAKAYFKDRDPIGRQIRLGIGDLSGQPWETVIGVVGDIRNSTLEEASQPQVFQLGTGNTFAISFDGSPEQVIRSARSALHSLDAALTIENVQTMAGRIKESNARRNFQTVLLTSFAIVAVLLALAGIYGLMSFVVKQRSSEIAIRLAIGSSRIQILGLMLQSGLRLTVIGLLIGWAGSLALSRTLTPWLFEVPPFDPVTFIVIPVFLFCIAALACIFPALQATRVNPAEALRQV